MIAAYGAGVLGLDYPTYVALFLNLPRVRLRQGAAVALGLGLVHGGGRPGREWAEALSESGSEAEVRELFRRMRETARDARRGGKGGGEWQDLPADF
jgi:hypothetical protein